MKTVFSKDGTRIAYNKNGNGPAVILVDGAFCSKDFGPMPGIVPLLAQNFTVISYDRRARGESGDTKPFNIQCEIEDINALIDVAGGSASLFGISSGAILCLKAAAYGLNVLKLALFEPPFVGNKDNRRSEDAVEQLNQMIANGERGNAVKFYLKKVIGLPAIIVFVLKLTPNWPKMKANANSLPYDAAICGDFNMPKEQIASITIPTLVIDSRQSPDILRIAVQNVAAVLANGKRISLKGKTHDVPPKVLVPELVNFYNS